MIRLFKKETLSNGRCHIYFCGLKIASYKEKHVGIFVHGVNNSVTNLPSTCRGYIYGNNNRIVFGDNASWCGNIFVGLPDVPVNDCCVIIGDGSTSNGVDMRICEDNTHIDIGKDCMFSSEVIMWASDTHTVINLESEIINIGKYIKIGNHVWVGMGATILKNTTIPDNCVIGTRSVVHGKFEKSNCAIAGNPGEIVKENIDWDRRRPKQYMLEVKNEDC